MWCQLKRDYNPFLIRKISIKWNLNLNSNIQKEISTCLELIVKNWKLINIEFLNLARMIFRTWFILRLNNCFIFLLLYFFLFLCFPFSFFLFFKYSWNFQRWKIFDAVSIECSLNLCIHLVVELIKFRWILWHFEGFPRDSFEG